jgi:4-amino-4-deoxy-L-arabinose transferase-like glycosyltransferase
MPIAVSRRTFNVAFGAICVVALAIRVFAAFEVNSIVPQSDAADYDRHALSLSGGDGYPQTLEVVGGHGPTAFRAPLYPFALAAVYLVVDTSDESARWLAGRLEQAVIGTAVVALIGLIALQLWGRRPALIAGAIAAVYPPLIVAGTSLLTEPLFTALLLGGVAALLRYRSSGQQVGWLVAAGACAGLASLTRGNGIAIVLIFALGAWVARPRWSRHALIGPAVLVVCSVIVVLPWTVRNAIEMDAFVPVTDQTGVAIGGQYNDVAKANDWSWVGPWDVPAFASIYADRSRDEVDISRELTSKGIDYVRDHPGAVPSAAFHNVMRLFSLKDPVAFERTSASFVGEPKGLAQAAVYGFWLVGALAIVGAFSPLARRLPGFIWAIVPLLVISIVFVAGSSRYRAPLEPVFILFAAAAIEWPLGRIDASGRASG